MTQITLHGTPCNTSGELPAIGDPAPDFRLTDESLADVRLADFRGRHTLLSIVPSLDTPVCALSAKRFNEEAKRRHGAAFVVVSADLPFAMKRFCTGEGLENVRVLAMMRSRQFAEDYGVLIVDGPLAGITARAVMVLDSNGKVVHAELVKEIGDEPDYQTALKALDALD